MAQGVCSSVAWWHHAVVVRTDAAGRCGYVHGVCLRNGARASVRLSMGTDPVEKRETALRSRNKATS